MVMMIIERKMVRSVADSAGTRVMLANAAKARGVSCLFVPTLAPGRSLFGR